MPDTETDDRKKLVGRILFSLGILWGVIPMVSLPMIVFGIGSNESGDLILAGLFNGMTVLPASVLAFWKRKTASWWLIADAFAMAMVGSVHFSNPAIGGPALAMTILAPAILGGFGLFCEKKQWPPLLDPNWTMGSKLF